MAKALGSSYALEEPLRTVTGSSGGKDCAQQGHSRALVRPCRALGKTKNRAF